MWRSVLGVFLCAMDVVLVEGYQKDSLEVKIESGTVRGHRHRNAPVFEFFDIPYATAPTGVNKFGAPLKPPTWSTTRDAVDTRVACPQITVPNLTLNKVENCLVASIFVPDTSPQNVPVIVLVHGGAFIIGYGNSGIPYDLVIEHNIIAVTFNYRLGVHGFLCLGTEDIPGNAGMKDQVALLRWVKKNIASFGGNPDDVTIAGSSAGSASVDLLMLSKSASGLFNKVIAESGFSLASYSIQPDPLEPAKTFAKSLKFDNVDDIDALNQFYKTASWEQLTPNTSFLRTDSTFMFSPCVERSLTGKELFLDTSPLEILKNNKYKKLPVLYSFANMEGLLRIKYFDKWKSKMNEKFSDFLPANLIFDSEDEKENVAKKVKEFYFGDKPVDNDTILHYVNFFTDIMFSYPALRSVKLHLENDHNQIYLYEYSFVDENTPVVPHTNVRGAGHCAQTNAVFIGPTTDGYSDLTEEFKKLTFDMRQIYANFIKTGKPVPEGSDLPSWPPVTSNWSPYMSIGNEMKLKGPLLLERTLFWEDIYNKYDRKPVPPAITG